MGYIIQKPRGDTIKISFRITSNGSTYVIGPNDKIFFSAKKDYRDVEPALFQSTDPGGGITYNPETEHYLIVVPSEKTSKLDVCTYKFDIELVQDFSGAKDTTTLILGDLVVYKEVTSRVNEV